MATSRTEAYLARYAAVLRVSCLASIVSPSVSFLFLIPFSSSSRKREGYPDPIRVRLLTMLFLPGCLFIPLVWLIPAIFCCGFVLSRTEGGEKKKKKSLWSLTDQQERQTGLSQGTRVPMAVIGGWDDSPMLMTEVLPLVPSTYARMQASPPRAESHQSFSSDSPAPASHCRHAVELRDIVRSPAVSSSRIDSQ